MIAKIYASSTTKKSKSFSIENNIKKEKRKEIKKETETILTVILSPSDNLFFKVIQD